MSQSFLFLRTMVPHCALGLAGGIGILHGCGQADQGRPLGTNRDEYWPLELPSSKSKRRELRSLWAKGQKKRDLICFECVSVANGMVVVITKETKSTFGVLRLCRPSELREAAPVSQGRQAGS